MKKTLLLCAFLVGLVSSNVMALTLDEARTQGRVGETFYGYLVALKTDAETEKLVADINAERKASYQQLAKQNNVSVDDSETRRAKARSSGQTGGICTRDKR